MSEGKIVKPNMRNLVYNNAKKHIVGSLIFASIIAAAWKFGHTEPLRRKYEHFHKVYDPVKAEEEMLKAGMFDSFPDGKV